MKIRAKISSCISALILLGFILSSPASATSIDDAKRDLITRAHALHLSDQPTWRRLLHDHRNWWGRYQSDVDDAGFFASPNGRRDPSAELDATLAAFFDPPSIDTSTQSAQCRYPARFTWLDSQLHFDPVVLARQSCPRFEAWKSTLNATSVTVVFASYYMNNPASMYGHPFMRFGNAGQTSPLLNYTMNFAADANGVNGLLYTVYGLGGGYRGRFSTMPYYMKVQEYNNMESRDLWEYSVALDSAAVHRLIDHLWELGQTSMAYYFFNKNCAYQLMPLLEVADPSLRMSDAFHFKAIPTDTLRAIVRQPGLVTKVARRPSHVTQMLERRALLSPREIRLAEAWVENPNGPPEREWTPVSPMKKAQILDSAYDLFRYRVGFAREQPAAAQAEERRLLLARNALHILSPPLAEDAGPSPDQSHPTGRLGIAYGVNRHSHFEELDGRPAAHDSDDPPTGYLPGSQMQMFHTRIRYDNDRKTAYLQQLSLVDIKSFTPLDRWVRHASWKINTGADVANDLDRDPENSLYYRLNAGSGAAVPLPFSRGSMAYALIEEDAGTGHVFHDGYRIGGGGSSGVLFSITDIYRVRFEASYMHYIFGRSPSRNSLECIQSFSFSKRLEGRVTLERQNHYNEGLVSLLWFL